MNTKFIFLILLFYVLASGLFGQTTDKQLPFKKSSYPSSKFFVTSDTALFGQLQIVITNTTPKNNSGSKFLCRSWLTIIKGEKVVKQKFYDIEPVGGCSGLYPSPTQTLKQLYIISKFGDYEGETILIDTTGKVTVLPGGSFSISGDKKYLFSIWDSDLSGITIYDLSTQKVILNKESDGELSYTGFYFQDGNYYASFNDEISVDHINLKGRKIVKSKKSKGFLKKSNKLILYNDVQKLPRCNCGQP